MAKVLENQAVFFELDGVIVREARLQPDGTIPYLPGALAALSRIDPRRFQLFVASNREDIAFGRYLERDFRRFCAQFLADAEAAGLKIGKMYTCPFHPRGKPRYRKESVFRKPAPGIFKMAQQEFDLNLNRCWMIGHTTSDILAAQRANVGTILVQTGAGGKDGAFTVEPHFVERDIRGAIVRILGFEHALRV
jgi:D-glycero-D-manno-heptose 1,7-bisphosphate phosphatase